MIKTRAVAASASRNLAAQERANLTHAVDTETGRPLCRKVKPESLLDDRHATEENAPATCPVCAAKDPRGQTGGPFVLSSLLQF